MDEALLQQEVERSIDGRWRCAAPGLPQTVQQLVGAGRRHGVQDKTENAPTKLGQVRTTPFADRLRPIEQAFGPPRELSRHPMSSVGTVITTHCRPRLP